MDLLRDESKPAGAAFWADQSTASWPPPPPANLATAEVTAPDRRRAGRHAAPRNPGHHGGAGQHARASLAALAFG
jgi:hypothetical protein